MFDKFARSIRKLKKSQPPQPLAICTYHKCGTVLLHKVFAELSIEFGWTFAKYFGHHSIDPSAYDVVLYDNAQFPTFDQGDDVRGLHIHRDPREVVISAYLYHLRCDEQAEPWCFVPGDKISPADSFPSIPYVVQEINSESESASYIQYLNGATYRDNLKRMSQDEGLTFEIGGYSRYVLDKMSAWDFQDDRFSNLTFEQLMSNFQETFEHAFKFLGLSAQQIDKALAIARRHDVNTFSDTQLSSNKHIASPKKVKRHEYFSPFVKDAYHNQFNGRLAHLESNSDNE